MYSKLNTRRWPLKGKRIPFPIKCYSSPLWSTGAYNFNNFGAIWQIGTKNNHFAKW